MNFVYIGTHEKKLNTMKAGQKQKISVSKNCVIFVLTNVFENEVHWNAEVENEYYKAEVTNLIIIL